ncbi:eukaryotic translation initiation factor 2-alpha kinase 3 isoform X1 [Poecilia reticulata]|uniref:Interferon-induced, double-stranded RNA-activated protein kinase n=1 Tax=Poecilia reticulata TaxID=8081 RepID=A0A3P9NQ07_POERE|nr:PREDICTED: eukaryotic translation initiation factor 2-alpha kinase 3 isoform X1 [Poecilia reticulata]
MAENFSRESARSESDHEAPADPDVNSVLLTKMQLNDPSTDLLNRLENIISNVVNKEISAAVTPLETQIASIGSAIHDLKRAANDQDGRLAMLEASVNSLNASVGTLSKKCEDLEDRSGPNNIRLAGVPGGSEDHRPTEFVSAPRQDPLGLDAKPSLDRAQRTLRVKPAEGDHPNPLVARVSPFRIQQSDSDSKVSEDGAKAVSQSDALHSNESSSHDTQKTSSDSILFADFPNPPNNQMSRKSGSGGNEPSPTSQDSAEPSQSEMTGSSDPADSSQASSDQNDVENQEITNPRNPPVQSRFTSEFEILKYLGGGGFGCVFMVKKKLLGLNYAVKIVPGTEKALREVTALSELQHENIVRYYNCWTEDSKVQQEKVQKKLKDVTCEKYLFIKMELCSFGTLREWINEKNKEELPHNQRGADSLPVALQIVSGVEYIHSNNFIHRDLKPSNIMLNENGKVKIGDFGLVTIDRSEILIERTEERGTKTYMAPEQASKIYDRKVDMFSLGLIFFELLWKISTGHERAKVWDNTRNNELPKEFSQAFPFKCRIIKSLLFEDPDDRPEASQVKEQLERTNQHLDQHSV